MNIPRASSIASTIKQYTHRKDKWRELKTVVVVSGLTGCGKLHFYSTISKTKGVFTFLLRGLKKALLKSCLPIRCL